MYMDAMQLYDSGVGLYADDMARVGLLGNVDLDCSFFIHINNLLMCSLLSDADETREQTGDSQHDHTRNR